MARRDEFGLYDLGTESSSMDTLSDPDNIESAGDQDTATHPGGNPFRDNRHTRRHSDPAIDRITGAIDHFIREGSQRDRQIPDTGDRRQGHRTSDIGPSASQILLGSSITQAHSMGQSDIARSHELQVKKCKAQLIQMDELLRQERNPVIMGSLRTQRECLLEEITTLEAHIRNLNRASANIKRYKAQITMPEYRTPPNGYRRNNELDSKNILRVVHPPFNPDLHPKQRLKYVWDKLLTYGWDNYFTEAEYLSALGMVLSGEPFETYNRCVRAKNNLMQTIEELTTFYESGSTINDIKRDLANFKRLAGETITKTMCRYRALVEKMRHEFTPEAWPEVRDVKIITMIKQVVSKTTRQHIELEESRSTQRGYQVPIDEYIRWAEEHEDVYELQPKKEITPMIQMATMAPTMHAEEVRRNNSELKALKSNKTWVDKNRDVMDALMEIKRGLKDLQISKHNHQMNTAALVDQSQHRPTPPQAQPHQGAYQPTPGLYNWAGGNQRQSGPSQGQTQPGQQSSQTWHESKKRKAEGEPQPQPTEAPPPEKENQHNQYRSRNQNRGGYNPKGKFTGRTHRGKQIYKVQGELMALCMPCTALHLSGDTCEADPDFGEIPADTEDTNSEETHLWEEGDPVNLETDTE